MALRPLYISYIQHADWARMWFGEADRMVLVTKVASLDSLQLVWETNRCRAAFSSANGWVETILQKI